MYLHVLTECMPTQALGLSLGASVICFLVGLVLNERDWAFKPCLDNYSGLSLDS